MLVITHLRACFLFTVLVYGLLASTSLGTTGISSASSMTAATGYILTSLSPSLIG